MWDVFVGGPGDSVLGWVGGGLIGGGVWAEVGGDGRLRCEMQRGHEESWVLVVDGLGEVGPGLVVVGGVDISSENVVRSKCCESKEAFVSWYGKEDSLNRA